MARVKFGEIEDAFQFVSFGPPMEHEAYLSKETGAIYWHSDLGDDLEPLPPDIDEGEKYLSIPHKNDLGLGKPLAIRFAADFLPDDVGSVREIFGRRGAYSRFKDFLERRGMLQRWYEYEAAAEKEALLKWCRENEIELDE